MREFSIEQRLEENIRRLFRKDRATYDALMNKIREILNCENVNHYKNLKKPLQHLKRVHVRGSFVLTFRYNQREDEVVFYDFDHHDKVYQ
jgi:mRNA-degrading endonuclease RelE of RelBE toxin-antitoxin system